MERLVGAQAWLKEGILPDGVFGEAAIALDLYVEGLVKKNKDTGGPVKKDKASN